MNFVSLISNTGIQFFDFKIKLKTDELRKLKFHYFEGIDTSKVPFKWWFEELIEINDLGKFIRKQDLFDLKISADKVNSDENILKIQSADLKLFEEEEERTYVIRNVDKTLKYFEKKWFPLPYFKNNQINQNLFGPTNWVRVWYEMLSDNEIHVALAIDTTLDDNKTQTTSPVFDQNPSENRFTLTKNEDSILSFMSSYTGCEWVSNWINSYFELKEDESQTKGLATFVHLLRIFNSSDSFPTIQLLSDQAEIIDIDLSIDIGNSRSCAILFETPNEGSINFNRVKKLQLRDLSIPTKSYSDPFSTRTVFRDENFGMKDTFFAQNEKFKWPSPVRLGNESERLINSVEINKNIKSEAKFFNSSPKRYLWDDQISKVPWHFLPEGNDLPKKVFKRGISEQLKSDGNLCTDGAWGSTPLYSRKTLMTFLFLEIFSQAISQCNSFEFRSTHGNPNARRRLRNVIITCPTAMIKNEQFALRKAAEDASSILKNYFKLVNSEKANSSPVFSESFDIIPRLADIRMSLDDLERRVDWMYDEATCGQLVFLYGLIQHKFDGNPTDLFKFFGHSNDKGSKSLTIGSLDIGGGTSDLMICQYDIDIKNKNEIIPKPLYYESFHLAGDDLIRNIIQTLIIEGQIENSGDLNGTGVIKNYGETIHGDGIYEKLNGFFGRDAAAISYETKLMRVNFLNQIGLPLALKYLECANSESPVELTFDEVFKDSKPSKELLRFFKNHFEFRFEDLVWNFDAKQVNQIVRNTFSKLIIQVAKLMHKFHCDYILISGRPCSLKEVEKMFVEIHPVNSNRFVNLNNYWIGKWYPFSDNNGYVNDPKTIVSTGALIGFMGTKFFKLDKFKINPKYLKTDLQSTANYIGSIKNNVLKEIYLSPSLNEVKIKVYSLPMQFGITNVNSKSYPARNIFQVQYNENYLNNLIRNNPNLNLQDVINRFNTKIPYEISLSREFGVDKEKITIEEIVNNANESQSNSLFVVKTITLADENGYWFDTAEFALKINSRI